MTEVSSRNQCMDRTVISGQSTCHAESKEGGSSNWNEKSLTELIEEFKNSLPLVEYRDGEFVFYDESRRSYAFEASRADTNAKLLEWIRHMTEKVWITGLHINEFIRLATRHLPKIKIDHNA